MNLCWESLWKGGQSTKFWGDGFLISSIILIDILLLGGTFRALMKLDLLASVIWYVMSEPLCDGSILINVV